MMRTSICKDQGVEDNTEAMGMGRDQDLQIGANRNRDMPNKEIPKKENKKQKKKKAAKRKEREAEDKTTMDQPVLNTQIVPFHESPKGKGKGKKGKAGKKGKDSGNELVEAPPLSGPEMKYLVKNSVTTEGRAYTPDSENAIEARIIKRYHFIVGSMKLHKDDKEELLKKKLMLAKEFCRKIDSGAKIGTLHAGKVRAFFANGPRMTFCKKYHLSGEKGSQECPHGADCSFVH
jgi:hypothetical protein